MEITMRLPERTRVQQRHGRMKPLLKNALKALPGSWYELVTLPVALAGVHVPFFTPALVPQ